MPGLTLSMELVGPNAGKTMTIAGRHAFVNGKYVLQGSHDQVEYALNYLAHFGAYVSGSSEQRAAEARYKAALAAKENANGVKRTIRPSEGRGPSADVSGANGPAGSGPAEARAVPSEQPSGSEGGSPRVLPNGSGHTNAGVSAAEQATQPGSSMSGLDRLRLVVSKLDPSNDAHWTEAGLPSLDAIQEAYPGVTRSDVEEVAPGFTRQAALNSAI